MRAICSLDGPLSDGYARVSQHARRDARLTTPFHCYISSSSSSCISIWSDCMIIREQFSRIRASLWLNMAATAQTLTFDDVELSELREWLASSSDRRVGATLLAPIHSTLRRDGPGRSTLRRDTPRCDRTLYTWTTRSALRQDGSRPLYFTTGPSALRPDGPANRSALHQDGPVHSTLRRDTPRCDRTLYTWTTRSTLRRDG